MTVIILIFGGLLAIAVAAAYGFYKLAEFLFQDIQAVKRDQARRDKDRAYSKVLGGPDA